MLPSLNVTVPVGVPVLAVTVAVKDTLWPNVAGFAEATSAVVVLAGLTISSVPLDVLGANPVAPEYTAVMAWVPPARVAVEMLATPELSRPELPSVWVPSMKVTDPVGTLLPAAAAVTVAVKVTLWPNAMGFAEATTATVVPPTSSMLGTEVLARKLALSPLYSAVIEWLPTVNEEVEMLAAPALNGAVPSGVVPSRKVTEPIGTPAPGETAET